MAEEVQTCPKCGALIVPQLVRCRQCGAYLHGTSAEGWIFEHLLPESAARSPGTALITTLIILYYLMMTVLTVPQSPSSVFSFSGFSLQQLGATHGVSLLRGQHWRYFTSIFAHHDLLHVAFNVWSLSAAGPLVEQIFDKKKMLLIYLASGVISMFVSFLWYVGVQGSLSFVSAGASGAVCGMIGAALFGARRMGPNGAHVASGMTRWAIYMVVWGLAMPAINNAAHLGGFVAGALAARFAPLGLAKSVAANRALSVLMLASLLGFAGAGGLMLAHLHGFPAALVEDAESRGLLGMRVYTGVEWELSDQRSIAERCGRRLDEAAVTDEAIKDCELSARANAHSAIPLRQLADLYERRGDLGEAQKLRAIARRQGPD
ncbi:MAG: rhomboid family intramembrane serine protease [Deltaproteobacteria bacterium]|nr:rhomboid family intramembrane serine protease [Deltaproteobacteria bacterium]